MVDLYHFAGLIFTDACTHAHYVLYNQTYFAGLIFAVRHSSAKIGPHENFLLYGINCTVWLGEIASYHEHIALWLIIILCFYFAYYSILQFLKNFPIIFPNMPIIIPLLFSLVTYSHLLVHNENSHIIQYTQSSAMHDYHDVILWHIAWSEIR